ncbi:MAG: TonB family protein [Ahniella sp.]|nr:TonB family protein [Ahniella sp.]
MNFAALMELTLTLGLVSALPALVLLLVGGIVRKHLGARAAYWSWSLVPITVLAALIGRFLPQAADSALAVLPAIGIGQAIGQTTQAVSQNGWTILLLQSAWLTGVTLMTIWLMVLQRHFARQLKDATPMAGNVYRGHNREAGPALIGVLTPRILLPVDFESRYSPDQQQLILLHEQIHQRRGDAFVNLLVAAWQVLNWFNPIVHLAAQRLRRDQELACDAEVLAQRPDSAKAYAEAMLSTQLAVLGLPVGCHWQSSHPLKERLIMLKSPKNTLWTRVVGVSLLAISGLTLAGAAIATQAGPATEFDVAPSYATLSRPVYPKSAIDAKISGVVMIRVGVDTDGKPATINIESAPDESLGKAAADSVASWTFNPAQKGGKPIATQILVPVTFSLDEQAAGEAPAASGDTQLDAIQVKAD